MCERSGAPGGGADLVATGERILKRDGMRVDWGGLVQWGIDEIGSRRHMAGRRNDMW